MKKRSGPVKMNVYLLDISGSIEDDSLKLSFICMDIFLNLVIEQVSTCLKLNCSSW